MNMARFAYVLAASGFLVGVGCLCFLTVRDLVQGNPWPTVIGVATLATATYLGRHDIKPFVRWLVTGDKSTLDDDPMA